MAQTCYNAEPSKPEWAPPILRWGPPQTYLMTSARLCPFPTTFLPPFSTLKALLTGSGEVLQCTTFNCGAIVLKVRNKFASRTSEKFLNATMLKVHLCWRLHLHGPLHVQAARALSLPCGLFTPIGPFTDIWGPRGRDGGSGWSAPALL